MSTVSSCSLRMVIRGVKAGNLISNTWPGRREDDGNILSLLLDDKHRAIPKAPRPQAVDVDFSLGGGAPTPAGPVHPRPVGVSAAGAIAAPAETEARLARMILAASRDDRDPVRLIFCEQTHPATRR